MDIKTIEKFADILCEGILTLKTPLKTLGISNPILDEVSEISSTILPSLDTLSSSDSSKLAETAYKALQKVKSTISP
jgi:hypothetical protein